MKNIFLNRLIHAVLLVVLLTSCAKTKEEPEEVLTPEVLYDRAENAFSKKNYQQAADYYAKIYLEHPYANIATKAKLMEAYTYYEKQDFDTAIAILEEFVKLHPAYQDIAYAYYLRAICYYQQISDSEHDQSQTLMAKNAINEMIIRFPENSYSKDLKYKLDLVNDHLAGNQMNIARFYQTHQDLIAAINRFNIVIKEYNTTNHVAEALARLVECYLTLGMKKQANKYAAILGYNYPDNSWYKYSYDLIQKFAK